MEDRDKFLFRALVRGEASFVDDIEIPCAGYFDLVVEYHGYIYHIIY